MNKIISSFLVITISLTSCSKANSDEFVGSEELNDDTVLHFDATFTKSDDD